MKTTSTNHDTTTESRTATTATDAGVQAGGMITHVRASIVGTLLLLIICCGVYPVFVWGIAQGIFPAKANGSLIAKDGTPAKPGQDAVASSLLGQNFSAAGYFSPRPSAAGAGYDATSSGGSNLGPLSDKLINGLTSSPTAPATQPAESLSYDGIRLRAIHYAVSNHIAFKLFNVAPDGSKSEVPLKTFQDAQGNLNDIALVDAFPHPTTADDAKRTVLIADNFASLIPADAVTASGSGLDPHISLENADLQKARVASARNITVDQLNVLIAEHTDKPGLGIFGEPGVNVAMLNLDLDVKHPLPAGTATTGK